MDIRHALLVHAGALGDFVLSLRVVQAIRQAGAERITVLGRPDIAGIAIPGGGVDAAMNIETGGFHALFVQDGPLPDPVRQALGRIDLAVNMMAGGNSTVAARLLNAGIDRVIDIDPRPRSEWKGHITDQWLHDLSASGIESHPGPSSISVSAARIESGRQELRAEAAGFAGPIAIVHPGSGSRSKCWPASSFANLAEQIEKRGWRCTFLLGPVERERMHRAELELIAAAARVIRNVSVAELPGLLAACGAYVGNDSGVTHLTAAVGARTIAVFGPTDARMWRPLGTNVRIVQPAAQDAWPDVRDVLNAWAANGDSRIERRG